MSNKPPSLSELERCYTTHGERFSLPTLDCRLSTLAEIEAQSRALLSLLETAHAISSSRAAAERDLALKGGKHLILRRVPTRALPATSSSNSSSNSSSSSGDGESPSKKRLPVGDDMQQQQQQQSAAARAGYAVAASLEAAAGCIAADSSSSSNYQEDVVDRSELRFDWQLRGVAARLEAEKQRDKDGNSKEETTQGDKKNISLSQSYEGLFVLLETISAHIFKAKAAHLSCHLSYIEKNALTTRNLLLQKQRQQQQQQDDTPESQQLQKAKQEEEELRQQASKQRELLQQGKALIDIYRDEEQQQQLLLRRWRDVFMALVRLPPGTPPNPHIRNGRRLQQLV